jgi:hypothetical protein
MLYLAESEQRDVSKAVKHDGLSYFQVNKRYRLLEIEMDGIFKRMLLLKKKKYAALKVEPAGDGTLSEVSECLGCNCSAPEWFLSVVLMNRGEIYCEGSDTHIAHFAKVSQRAAHSLVPELFECAQNSRFFASS